MATQGRYIAEPMGKPRSRYRPCANEAGGAAELHPAADTNDCGSLRDEAVCRREGGVMCAHQSDVDPLQVGFGIETLALVGCQVVLPQPTRCQHLITSHVTGRT